MLSSSRMILALFLPLLFWPALSIAGAGGLALEIDSNLKLNDWEKSRVEAFFKQTIDKLPLAIRETIQQKITVNFVDFPPGDDLKALGVDVDPRHQLIAPCEIITRPKSATEWDQVSKKVYHYQSLGKTVSPLFGGVKSSDRIELNRLLLNEILKGPDQATAFPCGHRNFYRHAMGTLVHEIGHVFDDQTGISKERRFRFLAGFDSSWLFEPETKNKLRARSPDVYEYKDPAEYFGVNLEYYVLDPEYACRKPTFARFFEERFGKPLGSKKCESSDIVELSDFMSGTKIPIKIDPKRVYSIDYLLADKGEQFSSRWGHAMMRIVVCAPDRVKKGPECRKDIADDIVISFRANPGDIKLDPLKGLTGGYPSQMFLLPMTSVIKEYNRLERRNLKSMPLQLTEDETRDFLDHVKETLWTYSGEYRFLTNNCASETKDFLKAIVRNSKVEKLSAISPTGLYDELARIGLLDRALEKQADKAQVFESFTQMQLDALNGIRKIAEANGVNLTASIGCGSLSDYITKTTPEERLDAYFTLVDSIKAKQGKAADLEVPGHFFVLEDEIRQYLQARFAQEYMALMVQLSEDPKILESAEKELGIQLSEKLKEAQEFFLQNLAFVGQGTKGYGVPLANEKLKNETVNDEMIAAMRMSNLADDFKKLEDWTAKRLAKSKAEYQHSVNLYQTFGDDFVARPSKWIETGAALRLQKVRNAKNLVEAAVHSAH